MRFEKKVISSSLIAGAALISSMILPIIPCKISSSVPNSASKWAMCNLNPDAVTSINYTNKFLGYTTSIRDTYFIILLITFAVAMIFFHYAARKKG